MFRFIFWIAGLKNRSNSLPQISIKGHEEMSGKFEKAKEIVDSFIAEFNVFISYGRFDLAEQLARDFKKEHPEVDIQNYLSIISEARKDSGEKVSSHQNEETKSNEVNEAEIYYAYGKYQKAKELLDAYLKKAPNDAKALYLNILIEAELKREEMLNKASPAKNMNKAKPQKPYAAQLEEARIFHAYGRYENAREILVDYLKDHDDEDARDFLNIVNECLEKSKSN